MDSKVTALFRQEVLDAKRGEWLGTVELAMPLPYRLFAVGSMLACILLMAFLLLGSYTRHEQVSGQLVPSLGLLTSSAPSAGTIIRALVHEGDSVAKGQPLVEISTELDSLAVGKTRAAISEELTTQRKRNAEALNDQARLTAQKQQALSVGVSNFQQQLVQIDTQIALQTEQAKSAIELWHRYEAITSGVISGTQVAQQKAAALSVEAEVAALRRQRADIERQLNEQREQLRQLPFTASTERAAIQQKLTDADQALAQNESQRAIVLRAAQSGIISSVAIKDGETIVTGQRLVSLVPQGSLLQAELWLPSRSIGFISSGNRVVLRYQAFPYQKFGQQIGEVADISRSAVGATELTTILGKKIEEPLYRVIVNLPHQTILAYGKPENLKPGMGLDADILLDKRRLIEWVFEPLFGFGRTTTTRI